MAQAWHTSRKKLELMQPTEARYWRATKYQLDDPENPAFVEATPDARWKRFALFDSYRPTSKTREIEAGPHLTFLKLKAIRRERPNIFGKALVLFAKEY